MACLGVATVGIWLWENQRNNVERLGKVGVLLPLAYHDGKDLDEKIFNAVELLLLNNQKRKKMRQKGQHLVDGYGAERVAKLLVNL